MLLVPIHISGFLLCISSPISPARRWEVMDRHSGFLSACNLTCWDVGINMTNLVDQRGNVCILKHMNHLNIHPAPTKKNCVKYPKIMFYFYLRGA